VVPLTPKGAERKETRFASRAEDLGGRWFELLTPSPPAPLSPKGARGRKRDLGWG
jgi:hypothetical protein